MPLLLEECSPQLELLEQLHEALCSYSDAVQALDRFHEVYGLPPLPPDEEAAEAARAMAHEFESTRSHVLAVDDVQQAGFVILARDSLSEVRAERRAAPSRRTATAPRAHQCPPSASAPHPHPRARRETAYTARPRRRRCGSSARARPSSPTRRVSSTPSSPRPHQRCSSSRPSSRTARRRSRPGASPGARGPRGHRATRGRHAGGWRRPRGICQRRHKPTRHPSTCGAERTACRGWWTLS